ncbi:hypothetical protein ACW2Q0_29235 [Nocardia sp. R16R-3T]
MCESAGRLHRVRRDHRGHRGGRGRCVQWWWGFGGADHLRYRLGRWQLVDGYGWFGGGDANGNPVYSPDGKLDQQHATLNFLDDLSITVIGTDWSQFPDKPLETIGTAGFGIGTFIVPGPKGLNALGRGARVPEGVGEAGIRTATPWDTRPGTQLPNTATESNPLLRGNEDGGGLGQLAADRPRGLFNLATFFIPGPKGAGALKAGGRIEESVLIDSMVAAGKSAKEIFDAIAEARSARDALRRGDDTLLRSGIEMVMVSSHATRS